MKSAFPKEWGGGGDSGDTRRLAALKRAKGPRINATKLTLKDAMDLQNNDDSYWRKYLAEYSEDDRRAGEKLFLEMLEEMPQKPLFQEYVKGLPESMTKSSLESAGQTRRGRR
jgi:hypothetical protein